MQPRFCSFLALPSRSRGLQSSASPPPLPLHRSQLCTSTAGWAGLVLSMVIWIQEQSHVVTAPECSADVLTAGPKSSLSVKKPPTIEPKPGGFQKRSELGYLASIAWEKFCSCLGCNCCRRNSASRSGSRALWQQALQGHAFFVHRVLSIR